MGLLALGTALSWPEAKEKAVHVREWGIEQLLNIWRRAKEKEQDVLLWGDEIEYLVVALDCDERRARLSLRQHETLASLVEGQKETPVNGYSGLPEKYPNFQPEFGRFMIEATPGAPWGINPKDLLKAEPNLRWRRAIVEEHLEPNEYPVTLTTFPNMGSRIDSITPYFPPSGPILRSQFVPDEMANPHIRFATLAGNIRARRRRKVEINVPIYRDEKTPWPFRDPTVDYDLHHYPEDHDVRRGAAKDGHVYMDAMAFGMGSCCSQVTFQCKNIDEGRRLYDQLSPLGPIILALTAATPMYKGFLVDTDVRWNQISASVDDRTPEELGESQGGSIYGRLPKSRYACNSTYIARDPRLRPEYMDPELAVNEDVRNRLKDGGMDDILATHFAHLFIRDPLVIFNEDLLHLDRSKGDHFENIQSTNWQHIRFKPPPADNDKIGWRVEFRPIEAQLTDFENAAFSVFTVLLTRAIISFDLNFYIPIPRTTENMQTAHARNAVLDEKFWFRKRVLPKRWRRQERSQNQHTSGNANKDGDNDSTTSAEFGPVEDEYRPMGVAEIINGTASLKKNQGSHKGDDTDTGNDARETEEDFPGLVPLVEAYLDDMNVDVDTRCKLSTYLNFVRRRASGELWTNARWLRDFVTKHHEYRHDSVVSEGICFDVVKVAKDIARENGKGEIGREMF